jgi:hypothetical protein
MDGYLTLILDIVFNKNRANAVKTSIIAIGLARVPRIFFMAN